MKSKNNGKIMKKTNVHQTDKSAPKDCMQIDCDLRISNQTHSFQPIRDGTFYAGPPRGPVAPMLNLLEI